jgi:uncharacterized protein
VTVYFFDSSALTKRYIAETGTQWVRTTVAPGANHTILIAQITPVEVMSAVARQKREQTIDARTARAIRLLLERHSAREYDIVLLSEGVLSRAQDLLDSHNLRAYDAVQLAAALDSESKLTRMNLPSLIFVSADHRLLLVATQEGLQGFEPT